MPVGIVLVTFYCSACLNTFPFMTGVVTVTLQLIIVVLVAGNVCRCMRQLVTSMCFLCNRTVQTKLYV